jgi:hypothetical protein
LQQLPPFPDNDPGPSEPGQPSQPSAPPQPSEAPAEAPGSDPNIDVPSPSSPGTEAPTTPISPIG